jgi:outer membrane protein assembly factor BamE (lipoprotein component of BamABCDE complex)
MTAGKHRVGLATLGALTLAAGLSGCASIRNHQGYVVDRALVASVQPGVDTRDSVRGTLGDPSFESQFGPPVWYYVSRSTRQFSFGLPKAVDQLVLVVNFDPKGNVASVRRTGLEEISRIHPVGDKTPTLGRKRSLFQELFGNIGAVGATGMNAPTADNPNGGGTSNHPY